MILQKLKNYTGRQPRPVILAQDVDDLRRHDWDDPLFDQWCTMATNQLAGEPGQEGALHQLVSRVCV